DAELVFERAFEVQLGEDWQIQAEKRADLLDERAGSIDKARRGDRVRLACRRHSNRGNVTADRLHTGYLAVEEAHAVGLGLLEQNHAQLLAAEPAAAAGVEDRDG